MKAIWNGVTVAESDDTLLVEGEHYFPAASVRADCLLTSNRRSMDSARGECRYHNLFVNGDVLNDAVWYYPEPYEGAADLKGRMAFIRGVRIEE
ncbi:DUF427 domain-containing protein [Sphaerotilus microaerophilus]|uniref:DUF427 domain-containing protein n=1 Tax=Sphaerotilus microaerophilus TaxID=2914710 RepID=A0ABM7YMP1_9BURK|nr:DUF427 domain-containing protein [Sphaerotilus sp. FB-5]BDI05722.1 hypothetical protein CATMQ487_26920 [Sphaerotilus sp. FB-5]